MMHMINCGKSQLIKDNKSHQHSVCEVILNLCGEGEMLIGGKALQFRPGMIVCIPPELTHEKHSDMGFKDIFYTTDFLMYINQSHPTVAFDDEEGSIANLMNLMYQKSYKHEYNCHKVVESLSLTIEQMIISRIKNDTDNDSRINLLIDKMIDDFTKSDLSVTSLIEESGYNKDYLRRLFKKSTGITPTEYLTNLRVRYAERLMREQRTPDYTVEEIATMSGFNDSGYFARSFRKLTGASPKHYMLELKSKKPFSSYSNSMK